MTFSFTCLWWQRIPCVVLQRNVAVRFNSCLMNLFSLCSSSRFSVLVAWSILTFALTSHLRINRLRLISLVRWVCAFNWFVWLGSYSTLQHTCVNMSCDYNLCSCDLICSYTTSSWQGFSFQIWRVCQEKGPFRQVVLFLLCVGHLDDICVTRVFLGLQCGDFSIWTCHAGVLPGQDTPSRSRCYCRPQFVILCSRGDSHSCLLPLLAKMLDL